ncbi:NfeD family protein [uncultured Oscillibacter sp.]|jgi:membrane protein implicated in regulation of membrane protease activity|uniref:NfeD family protein n=1 Tax=uncultured Oscillibacter sp. TaxID=876091 RepID=UPI002173471D|nr:NfeD family protein [uncultured Oscillibacter sp.]MCI9555176.1 NfeD family protein [Oscillibacter sp.]
MDIFIWLWLGAIVLFGVAEVVTEGMISIWFVAGSLAGLVTCMSGWALGGLSPEATQVLVFAVVSAAALVLTRPLVRRFMTRPHVPTNLDRVLGMVGKVTEAVDNERASGAVYVDGKTWTARSADGSAIPAGTQVKVQKIEGVKLLVQYSEKVEVTK